MMITISRSQSRITSSTLSIWKNTYSNFNMVTLYLINMKPIISKTIPPGKTIELVLLRRSFLDYQQHSCMSYRVAFKMTANNFAIAIDMTFAMDIIRLVSVIRLFFFILRK